MEEKSTGPRRDLGKLMVPAAGRLRATGDAWEPWELLDASGERVEAVAVYFRDLLAAGRAEATLRCYGMDLLRWFRFLSAVGVPWERATRCEARDFSCWLAGARKAGRAGPGSAVVNAVTGKADPGVRYAARTRVRSETVLRRFYDLHVETGAGPVVNPFPLERARGGVRAGAHGSPMEPFAPVRTGLYRPRVPRRVPRCIPDEWFDRVFAALPSHRDRALVALWVSTGARASELLGARVRDADPGEQLITVVRKGSRAVQQLPASPDAFVWLRLYQAQLPRAVSVRSADPLWRTLRRPFGALTYHAAHRMFERVNASLGANWTLHDLRHTAAHRMARDPQMPLTDVQWVLGHAHLSTTQLYMMPTDTEAIEAARAFHARAAERTTAIEAPRPRLPAADGYRAEAWAALFPGTAG